MLRHYATNWQVAGSIPDGVRIFLHDIILPVALWPGIDSVSNRNEYQVCFLSSGMLLGVKVAGAYG